MSNKVWLELPWPQNHTNCANRFFLTQTRFLLFLLFFFFSFSIRPPQTSTSPNYFRPLDLICMPKSHELPKWMGEGGGLEPFSGFGQLGQYMQQFHIHQCTWTFTTIASHCGPDICLQLWHNFKLAHERKTTSNPTKSHGSMDFWD